MIYQLKGKIKQLQQDQEECPGYSSKQADQEGQGGNGNIRFSDRSENMKIIHKKKQQKPKNRINNQFHEVFNDKKTYHYRYNEDHYEECVAGKRHIGHYLLKKPDIIKYFRFIVSFRLFVECFGNQV